jgi:TRAP-type C4-dicarboxylate transport system permease small subunit
LKAGPMTGLRWLLGQFEGAVAGVLLALGLGIVMLEIVARSLADTSFPWSEELSRYLLIWITYFGAAAVTRDRGHIRVEILIDRLNPAARRLVEMLVTLLCLVFSSVICLVSLRYVADSRNLGIMSADSYLPVPIWMFQSIIPIGFGLISLRLVLNLIDLWTGGSGAARTEAAEI